MNKLVKVLLVSSVIVLVGCKPSFFPSSKRQQAFDESWKSKVNTDELTLLSSLRKYQKGCSPHEYSMTSTKVAIARRESPNEGRAFCDVIPQIRMDSNWECKSQHGGDKTTYLHSVFSKSFGQTLEDYCSEPTEPNYNQDTNIVTTTKGKLISPDIYKHLISSAKSCKRAELKLIEITDGKPLTEDKYEGIMTVIAECNAFQLEKALNQQ